MSTNVNLAFFTLLIIAVVGILTYLAVRSGSGYSVKDAEAHAERFAGDVKEGHGGMTAFCWVTIGAIIIWSIVYLIMNWSEFAVVFFR
jgi:hypothetical protein